MNFDEDKDFLTSQRKKGRPHFSREGKKKTRTIEKEQQRKAKHDAEMPRQSEYKVLVPTT